MDHTRRLLLLPLWADGNWFVMFFFFFKVAIVGIFFSFFLVYPNFLQIMFLPWLRGETLQECECLIPPLGLDSKSRFSSFLPPLRSMSGPTQDQYLHIDRGFGR